MTDLLKPGSKSLDGRSGPVRSVQGASSLAGRSKLRTTEATKCYPRVKRIAGISGVPSRSTPAKAYVGVAIRNESDVELPGVGEDGM